MNKKILFSPVGGTDPISLNNYCDGSLLHICRYYKPDKVILYMSKEIIDNHHKDNRYLYCLEKLAELQERSMEYQIIERPALTKVHEFDVFYEDYREIINNILLDMDETDQLLLNVSSGTPAMKSGLLVLQTLTEYPCTLVQVATPVKKMNEHNHEGYDVEVLWDLNEDNTSDAINRCKEVVCPTLTKIKQEEIIKKHVSVYDYQAALSVLDTIPKQFSDRSRDFLKLGEARLLLDIDSVKAIQRRLRTNILPSIQGQGRELFEYALSLQIRLLRREYVDFIRAITPIVVDLFELILENTYKVDIDDYCVPAKGNSHRKWDPNKLKKSKFGKALSYKFNINNYDIYSGDLLKIINLVSDDEKLKKTANDIRSVESNVRNIAAHQIVSITDEVIKQRTEFTSEEIMRKIKVLFSYAYPEITSQDWKSYDAMNDVIIENLQ